MKKDAIVENLARLTTPQLQETARLLVEKQPKLAETIEFLISVELQEKYNASKI